ncbi:hypothetical protein ILUMI_01917 [Ignelater luminosus]|uniref:Uncharacterized protein n=1 Tax=Ignelater luminosus TaxID=2038154 RepID=A0A8K0DJ82_IGNLU|nr:hypothetical protein ILUMI_01917 [Ignelater luminosus]
MFITLNIAGETYTFLAAYGPGENDSKESIEAFWDNMQEGLDRKKGKMTRWERSREESSIIDYVLVEAGELKTVKDIQVRRSAEISSDDLLLAATINRGRKIKTNAGKEKLRSVIDTQKLKSKNCKRRYQERIREEIEAEKHELELENIEQLRQLFKNICPKAAEDVCRRKNEIMARTFQKRARRGASDGEESGTPPVG